ncbi:hypothetical protein Tco_0541027 [Tanacetum coccineum]
MADLKFVDQHNMVAYLEKSDENAEFHQIVDFLSTCSINYALIVSPTIYASYIEQFWNTATSKTINYVKQIHAIIDGKAVVISESSVRSDLLFDDEDGVTCLTDDEIFENLALMGYEQLSTKLTFQKGSFSLQWKFLIHTILHCISSKSTAWNEFSTNLASAVICLAKGQKFNFSKLIFDGMLRNLDSKKFLMYQRFLQLFLNNQLKDLPEPFNDTYVTPCHTKKVFSNMARKSVIFSGNITPLFASMLVQNQAPEGEGSAIPPEPQPTPSTSQPNVSEPQIETPPTAAPQTEAHQTAVSQIVFHEAHIDLILPSPTTYQRQRKTHKRRRTKKDTKLPQTSTLIKMKEQKAKEKGVAITDVEDSSITVRPVRSITTLQTLPTIDPKDKGKGVLVKKEPMKIKRSDQGDLQIQADAELAQRLHEEELAKLERRQKERLQQEKKEQFTIEERAHFFVETVVAQRKFKAAQRAAEIKSKPPTRTQLRNLMITYLKNTEVIKDSKKKDDSSSKPAGGSRKKTLARKRAGEKKSEESAKKQKLKDVAEEQESAKSDEEAAADYEHENEELRMWLIVVSDKEETVDPEILSAKYPIVDWESHNLGSVDMEDLHVYKIIRADRNTNDHKSLSSMLRKFDRQDLGDLKVMFEPNAKDEIWSNQQDWTLISWKLYESCGVHTLLMDGTLTCFNMLVEKRVIFRIMLHGGYFEYWKTGLVVVEILSQGEALKIVSFSEKTLSTSGSFGFNEEVSYTHVMFCHHQDSGRLLLYLTRRSLEVLRKFHWIILGGGFNQLVMKRFEDTTLEGYNLLLWGDLKKRYTLIKEMLQKMLNWKLEAKAESTMGFELLKFINSQLEE